MKNFFIKFKEQTKNFLKGMGIGAACIVPGVSGGTLAVMFNIFDKMIEAINGLFKHFKKSFLFLLPIILGIVFAIAALIIPINYAFDYIPFPIISMFAGFIIGSLPSLFKKIKGKFNVVRIILAFVAFVLVIGINFIPGLGNYDVSEINFVTVIITLVMGFVASFALVVPGISGSMLLLILGFYNTILSTLESLLHFSNFGHDVLIVIFFALGIVIGFFVVSKLIGIALAKKETETYFAIIGFVAGSALSLFVQFFNPVNPSDLVIFPSWAPSYVHIILSVVLLIIGLGVSLFISFYPLKKKELTVDENR